MTGWAMGSAATCRVPSAGSAVRRAAPAHRQAAAGLGHEAHEILGWVMLALVLIHVAAALRHHFLLRDGLLARMSFRRG